MKIEVLFIQQASFLRCDEKLRFLKVLESGDGRFWNINQFSFFTQRKLKSRTWNPHAAWKRAGREYDIISKGLFSAVCVNEPDYPPLLKEIYDPPFVLYYRGDLNSIKEKSVAVVGTRCPDGLAASASWKLGKDLGEMNVAVVSGLALGVDSFAQAGNHRGGKGSIAVLGSGLDYIYPTSNRKLAADLLSLGGAIVSEYPAETPPAPWRFPQRNRLISGLTPVSVVAQAPIKSGALITADFALEQGREVCVMQKGLNGERGAGTAALAAAGARVIIHGEEVIQQMKLCNIR